MGKLDAVIFDMDGTLLHLDMPSESIELVKGKLRKYFRLFDIESNFSPLLSSISKSMKQLCQRGYSEKKNNSIKEEVFRIVDANEIQAAKTARIRQGGHEMLRDLNHYTLGLVTSNGSQCSKLALKSVAISCQHFSTIVTREDTDRHKPNPEPLELALKKLGIKTSASKIVFIGDHVFDMKCGKMVEANCGLRVITIGLEGGICSYQDLIDCQEADFVVKSLREALDIIKANDS